MDVFVCIQFREYSRKNRIQKTAILNTANAKITKKTRYPHYAGAFEADSKARRLVDNRRPRACQRYFEGRLESIFKK